MEGAGKHDERKTFFPTLKEVRKKKKQPEIFREMQRVSLFSADQVSARKDPAHVCGNGVEAETQNEERKVCVWGFSDEAEEQTESQMSTSS